MLAHARSVPIHAHTYPHASTHVNAHVRTKNTRVCKCARAHPPTHTQTHSSPRAHTHHHHNHHTLARVRVHTHPRTDTHTHTHTHTHTNTYSNFSADVLAFRYCLAVSQELPRFPDLVHTGYQYPLALCVRVRARARLCVCARARARARASTRTCVHSCMCVGYHFGPKPGGIERGRSVVSANQFSVYTGFHCLVKRSNLTSNVPEFVSLAVQRRRSDGSAVHLVLE